MSFICNTSFRHRRCVGSISLPKVQNETVRLPETQSMNWPQVPSFQPRLCSLTGKLMLNGQLMCQVSTEWQIYASQLAKLFFKGHPFGTIKWPRGTNYGSNYSFVIGTKTWPRLES